MSLVLDLNCDMGEDPAATDLDEALLGWVTSANVACGGHAGDEASMRRLARLCRAHGVALGAHPAYPDRHGFGRRSLPLAGPALRDAVLQQVQALAACAQAEGATLRHVKPHGALYHDASRSPEVAHAIADAVEQVDGRLVLVAQAGSAALSLWRARGRRVAAEAFVDRAYGADGRLVARGQPGALLTDPQAAAAQALALARGRLHAGGASLAVHADTLCLHADTPGSLSIARTVRERLAEAGFAVRSPGEGG